MTNLEKLRRMSLEDFARYLAGMTAWYDEVGYCCYCAPHDGVQEGVLNYEEATEEWIKWLKEEAK